MVQMISFLTYYSYYFLPDVIDIQSNLCKNCVHFKLTFPRLGSDHDLFKWEIFMEQHSYMPKNTI